jgi:peptidoglycan-associated lipoprotein
VSDSKTYAAIALLFAAFMLSACPNKRPPAILTSPSPAESTDSSREQDFSRNDTDREIQPIGEESTNFTDLGNEWIETGPLADIHFNYDQYQLTALSQSILGGHAAWLKSHPGVRLRIEGHCDERGTVEYNLALGDRRASSARDYLVQLGIDPARLTTSSFGKERPVDPGHDEEAWARNRRAHFVVQR